MALPYAAVIIGLYLFKRPWVAMGLYHLGIILILLKSRPGPVVRSLRAGWSTGAGLAVTLLCAGSGPALILLWKWIALRPGELQLSLSQLGFSRTSWGLFVAYYVIVHPALEEIFWRDRLRSLRKGPALADAAFAGYHFLVLILFLHPFWAAAAVVILACTGWLWRRTAIRHQGLAIPVISHTAASLGTMAAVWFLSRY
jgi:hypothetical protein